jgi:hypothetical protein
MSDPPGHFMLFCKLQKGGLTDAKRNQRDIKNPIQMGGSGMRNIKASETRILSEITFPPYGYVMTIESNPPDPRLLDITLFSKYRYNDHAVKALRFVVLPTHSIYPGDYRTKEEIEKGSKASGS